MTRISHNIQEFCNTARSIGFLHALRDLNTCLKNILAYIGLTAVDNSLGIVLQSEFR